MGIRPKTLPKEKVKVEEKGFYKDGFYTVAKDDSFHTLAVKYYGKAGAASPLALVNGKKAKDALEPGETLHFPNRLMAQRSRQPTLSNLEVYFLICIEAAIEAECFAPGVSVWPKGDETKATAGDSCELKYTVVDFAERLDSARLEIVRKKEPNKLLAVFQLNEVDFRPGDHTYVWDGKCTEGAEKGRFVHVVHSPYLVRVVGKTANHRKASGQAEAVIRVKDLLVERPQDLPEGATSAPGSTTHYKQRLLDLGFHVGPMNGKLGSATHRAIRNFQYEFRGLRRTGKLDVYTKAYLDGQAPPGTGVDRYQFILNYLGYGCGEIDGLLRADTQDALLCYCRTKGIVVPKTIMHQLVESFGVSPRPKRTSRRGSRQRRKRRRSLLELAKTSLDAEPLIPVARREVLQGDLDVEQVYENPLPERGAEKRIYIYCSQVTAGETLAYNSKWPAETKELIRPYVPVRVRPLLESSSGKAVFSAEATGPLQINFGVDTTPPGYDPMVGNPLARAVIDEVARRDGFQTTGGSHAHMLRGGHRFGEVSGVFAPSRALAPYELMRRGSREYVACVTEIDSSARGTAGAYFWPSTIAGDRFALLVSVADEEGAIDTKPAPAVSKKTGVMSIWRRYQVSKRWIMEYAPHDHNIVVSEQLGIAPFFRPAYIEFLEPELPDPIVVAPRHATNSEVITVDLYETIIRRAGYSIRDLPREQIEARFSQEIFFPLTPKASYGFTLESAYKQQHSYYRAVRRELFEFEERFANALRDASYLEAPPGLIVLLFAKNAPVAPSTNFDPVTGLYPVNEKGLRPDWSYSVRAAPAVMHLRHDQDSEILAHEVGHGLWLHHATTKAGQLPKALDQPEHNPKEYETCCMSYIQLNQFCGRCVLKLRGFDESRIV